MAESHIEDLLALENAIKDSSFPTTPNDDYEMSRKMEIAFGKINEPDLSVEVWKVMMELLKTICFHDKLSELPRIVRSSQEMFFCHLKKDQIQASPEFFEIWAPVGADILHNVPVSGACGATKIIASFIDAFKETKPAKSGQDKLWIPIVLGCIKWPHPEVMTEAKSLIEQDKWKRMWKFKENLNDAKKIITEITALDLLLEQESENDGSDTVSAAGKLVEELMALLELYKVSNQVQEELAELCISLLEKGTPLINFMAKTCCQCLSLKKNQHLVVVILRRFLVLLKNEDYPWTDRWTSDAGDQLIQKCIEAYELAKEIKDDAQEAFLELYIYVCQPGHEIIDFEKGYPSVFGYLLTRMTWYLGKFQDADSIQRLEPLLPSIIEVMLSLEEGQQEDDIKQRIGVTLSQMNSYSSECLAPYLDKVITWYLQDQERYLGSIIQTSFPHNPAPVADKIDELIEAFVKDEMCYVLHCALFRSIGDTQPEIFNEKNFKLIMEHHWKHEHANAQVVMLIDKLVETRADLIEPYFVDKILNRKKASPFMASFAVKIILCIVGNYEEYKEVVFDYFIDILKSSKDDNEITFNLGGLRGFLGLFGADMMKPHMDMIKKLREEGGTMYVKDAAAALVDYIEGRSLEKLSTDVQQNKGDIEKLHIGLAGTKLVIRRVSKTVLKHDKDIKETKKELADVSERVDEVDQDLQETKAKVEEIDMKTVSNAPTWSRDVTKLMNPESQHDWRLLASRLGYSADDIRGWATQSDPCMALLSEWYATHKTVEASHGVLVALQEMNRLDAAVIVENAMKAVEGVVADEPVDYPEPPEIFLSYQWGHQNEVKLIQRHLEMAGYKCWMDVGQMGGGDKLFEKIDCGIRAAKVIICCVTEKYAKSPNCNREVNLSVNLGKPIIPLLMEKMSWPPKGSMGPIFSEYLFIRFFQRPGEETSDDIIWPIPKFQELLMQLNCLKVLPDESNIAEEYRNWWIPVVEKIVIQKKDVKSGGGGGNTSNEVEKNSDSPEIFISYQWGKQKEISVLYQRMTSLGFTCWMDIHQMGGGDSLYDKIDRGIRGCKVVLTSITQKYALSANCRREVSLADALKKPIIPLLMEKSDWPPAGPMSMVFTQLLFINFCKDESVQMRWDGPKFEELLQQIHLYVPTESFSIEQKNKQINIVGNNDEKQNVQAPSSIESNTVTDAKSASNSNITTNQEVNDNPIGASIIPQSSDSSNPNTATNPEMADNPSGAIITPQSSDPNIQSVSFQYGQEVKDKAGNRNMDRIEEKNEPPKHPSTPYTYTDRSLQSNNSKPPTRNNPPEASNQNSAPPKVPSEQKKSSTCDIL